MTTGALRWLIAKHRFWGAWWVPALTCPRCCTNDFKLGSHGVALGMAGTVRKNFHGHDPTEVPEDSTVTATASFGELLHARRPYGARI